jgi:hypothetical protein
MQNIKELNIRGGNETIIQSDAATYVGVWEVVF